MIDINKNRGFFLWLYYPQERHTPENVKQFEYKLLVRNPDAGLEYFEDETSGWAKDRNNFLNGIGFGYGARFILTEPGELDDLNRWSGPFNILDQDHRKASNKIFIQSDFNFYAGMPGSKYEYRKFQRPGCFSICNEVHTDSFDGKNPMQYKAVMYIVREFVSHFDVVYAFGHIDWNRWVRAHETMPAPERRIWPFNVFNLKRYDSVLLSRLRDYSASDPAWQLELVGDHIAMFHLKDLSVPETRVPSRATETILGTGDDILLPSGKTGI